MLRVVTYPADSGSRRFDTTHWTLVGNAAGESGVAWEALETLCQRYWGPLHGYALRWGCTQHDAQDLTQAFFAEFLARGYLRAADRARGRFRTFLLTAFRHFMIKRWRWERRQKRWKGEREDVQEAPKPGNARPTQLEPLDTCSPTEEYDRRWAITALDAGFESLRSEYRSEGRIELFEHLKSFLSRTVVSGDYERVAGELGMSIGAVAVAVHRLRKRFSESVLREVSGTVMDPVDARDELRYLVGLVASH